MEDDAIHALVTRLARPHRSGGHVIESAAIRAEGADETVVVEWILARDGQPETAAPAPAARGLHSARVSAGGDRPPSRYVLPPGW